ncbi:hypothetical protein A9972_07670 [Pseudomonas sp. UME83]|nr:hypothetical protein [Pseudomonas sp. UMC76]MBB1637917.1 hypothetical protein [Pseudomonas sp. UME83]
MPLLVQDGAAAPLPVLVPFLYVQLKLKYRAYNTAAAHLRAIQAFYIYAESRSLSIDEAILACRFESILAVLDGYAVWLRYQFLVESGRRYVDGDDAVQMSGQWIDRRVIYQC